MKVLISMLLMFGFFMLCADDLKEEKQEKSQTLKTEKAVDDAKHIKMLKEQVLNNRTERSGLKNGKSETAGKMKMSGMGRIGNRGKEGRENDPDLDSYTKSPAEAGLAVDKGTGKGKGKTSRQDVMKQVQKLYLKNLFTRVERGDRPGHENDSDHEKYSLPSEDQSEDQNDVRKNPAKDMGSFMSPITGGGWDSDSSMKPYQSSPVSSSCKTANCTDIRRDVMFDHFKQSKISKVGRPFDPEF